MGGVSDEERDWLEHVMKIDQSEQYQTSHRRTRSGFRKMVIHQTVAQNRINRFGNGATLAHTQFGMLAEIT